MLPVGEWRNVIGQGKGQGCFGDSLVKLGWLECGDGGGSGCGESQRRRGRWAGRGLFVGDPMKDNMKKKCQIQRQLVSCVAS